MHSKKAEISKIEKKKGVWQSIQLNSDQEKKVKKMCGGGETTDGIDITWLLLVISTRNIFQRCCFLLN